MIKDKLTNLCGNSLSQNDCMNTFCGIALPCLASAFEWPQHIYRTESSIPLSSEYGAYTTVKARHGLDFQMKVLHPVKGVASLLGS